MSKMQLSSLRYDYGLNKTQKTTSPTKPIKLRPIALCVSSITLWLKHLILNIIHDS
jgi:hypothetical protein